MKNLLFYIAILAIGIMTVSCDSWTLDGTSFYNDFRVENKLDTTITIQLVSKNKDLVDLLCTVPANDSKSIVFSEVGGGEGASPNHYKLVIVNYKNHILKDTVEVGNSLLNIRAYKEIEKSTYKKKQLNTFVFTIDSVYVNEHFK